MIQIPHGDLGQLLRDLREQRYSLNELLWDEEQKKEVERQREVMVFSYLERESRLCAYLAAHFHFRVTQKYEKKYEIEKRLKRSHPVLGRCFNHLPNNFQSIIDFFGAFAYDLST